jgi:hypothetical protein
MFAIGRRLVEVKDLLPHGQFEKWVVIELDYSLTFARQLMNVDRRLGAKSTQCVGLGTSIIRLLAAPWVPEEAIDHVLMLMQSRGKRPNISEVEAILEGYKLPSLPGPVAESKQHFVLVSPPQTTSVTRFSAPIAENRGEIEGDYTVVDDLQNYSTYNELERKEEQRPEGSHIHVTLARRPVTSLEYSEALRTATRDDLRVALANLSTADIHYEERLARLRERQKELVQAEAQAAIEQRALRPRAEPTKFDTWLAACPPDLSLRECKGVFELAKKLAQHARSLEPNALNVSASESVRALSMLIIAIEKELKK